MPELFEVCLHGRVPVGGLCMMFLFLCGYRCLLFMAWDTRALLPYKVTEKSMHSFWMTETESSYWW